MPDSLESAFQKVVENARANCPACREVAFWCQSDPTTIINILNDHTCRATIDAAAKGMLAAVGECNGISETCEKCQKRATINRLREEAK